MLSDHVGGLAGRPPSTANPLSRQRDRRFALSLRAAIAPKANFPFRLSQYKDTIAALLAPGAATKECFLQTLVLALFESPQSAEDAILVVWTIGSGCRTADEVDDNN